jgi:phosphohistidine phosphatase
MRLLLVQHGEAKDESEDPTRPLTEEGIRRVEGTAVLLSECAVEVAEIQHSGKKRSEQTAVILANHLLPARGVAAASGLNPNDDIRPCADKLANLQDSLMIVGHLPFLSRLTGLLVAGNPERDIVRFQNAGVVCLVRERERWSIAWIVVPSLRVEP